MARILYGLFIAFFLLISCEEIINEEDISDGNIQLLAPTNNAVLVAGDISFNWKTLGGAESYQLQIAWPDFTSAVQIVLDTTLSKNSFIQPLDVNEYEWRVRGINSAYETDYTVHAFTVEEP